jgi:hypothetical protein
MNAAFYIALVCASMASAAPGGKSAKSPAPFNAASSAPAAGGGSSAGTAHGAGTALGRALYINPRRAPEMAPERKVEELDCTKPLELAAGGNLKCK